MDGIYLGRIVSCSLCKESPGREYLMRSRFTGRVLCDLCVDFHESANFDYLSDFDNLLNN